MFSKLTLKLKNIKSTSFAHTPLSTMSWNDQLTKPGTENKILSPCNHFKFLAPFHIKTYIYYIAFFITEEEGFSLGLSMYCVQIRSVQITLSEGTAHMYLSTRSVF